MTREEAIAIFRAGEKATVMALLESSAVVEKLTKRVEKLEEALARKSTDSSNSSKPPSSDAITKPPGKRRAEEGEPKRRPGGQVGHRGITRPLVPENEVNRFERLCPAKCRKCGAAFPESPPADMLEAEPKRHQQFEIPPKSLIVTEYQRHGCRCSCGATTWAKLPPEAVSGSGPRLSGILAFLTAGHRITRRGNHEIVQAVYGVAVSPASVCTVLEEAGDAVEDTYEELACTLPDLPFINVDESGWRVGLVLEWLWIFVAPMFVVFRIGPRTSETLEEMLGEDFSGSPGL